MTVRVISISQNSLSIVFLFRTPFAECIRGIKEYHEWKQDQVDEAFDEPKYAQN